jgi:hypothetical protein
MRGSYTQRCLPLAASKAKTRPEVVLKYSIPSTMIGVASKATLSTGNRVPA